MYRDIKVRITGISTNPDGEKNTTFTEAAGKYAARENGAEIRFAETEDGNKILTTVEINPGSIRIRKSGAVASDMYFAPNNTASLNYMTPYGELSFINKCMNLSVDFTEEGGCAEVNYDLFTGDDLIAGNFVKITYEFV